MLNKKWMAFFLSANVILAAGLWKMESCHSSQTPPSSVSSSPVSPTPATDYKIVGKFRDTFYYVVLESDYASRTKDTSVKDMNGHVLATVSKAFKKAMDIEGTGKLDDGRVVNYAGVKNREVRYQVTVHSYGRGVGNCELIPFHSVAMDKREIALGSVVFIDETQGMKLPDGTLHDGYWKVDDVGGAIKKDRIDLFVGIPQWGPYLAMSNIKHLQPLTVRLVSGPTRDSCVDDTPQ